MTYAKQECNEMTNGSNKCWYTIRRERHIEAVNDKQYVTDVSRLNKKEKSADLQKIKPCTKIHYISTGLGIQEAVRIHKNRTHLFHSQEDIPCVCGVPHLVTSWVNNPGVKTLFHSHKHATKARSPALRSSLFIPTPGSLIQHLPQRGRCIQVLSLAEFHTSHALAESSFRG
jgi:hypothetical protein